MLTDSSTHYQNIGDTISLDNGLSHIMSQGKNYPHVELASEDFFASGNGQLLDVATDVDSGAEQQTFVDSIQDMSVFLARITELAYNSNSNLNNPSEPTVVVAAADINAEHMSRTGCPPAENNGFDSYTANNNNNTATATVLDNQDILLEPYAPYSTPEFALEGSFGSKDSAAELTQFESYGNTFDPMPQANLGCSMSYQQAPDHHSNHQQYLMFNPSHFLQLPSNEVNCQVLSEQSNMNSEEFFQQGYDSGFSSPPSLQVYNPAHFASPPETSYPIEEPCPPAPVVRRKRSGRPRIHSFDGTNNVELLCPYPNCGKKFSRFHNLKSHLIVHTDGKPFKCFECDMSFRRNHDLRRHDRMHKGLRPFACKMCDKTFCRSDALKRHIKVGACANAQFDSIV